MNQNICFIYNFCKNTKKDFNFRRTYGIQRSLRPMTPPFIFIKIVKIKERLFGYL